MKQTFSRRIHRKTASKESSVFKKQASSEGGFFSPSVHQPFFAPQPTVHRKCEECDAEEKKLQKKENTTAPQAAPSRGVIPFGGGRPLPVVTAQFFSAKMGHDFSRVEVYTGPEAADSAKQLNAQAYTIGNRVVFNDGRYDPETEKGKKLLAHELVHVMQQNHQHIAKKDEEQDCNEKLDLEG